MTDNPKRLNFNFNIWNKHIPDCAIRAISAATGLDYRAVCQMLGYAWKNNYGLIRQSGSSMNHINNVFKDYFDVVENFFENFTFVPDEFKGTKQAEEIDDFERQHGLKTAGSGITLNEFIDLFAGQGTFLVQLVENPDSQDPKCRGSESHLVCVKCNPKFKQGFIEYWDCGDMLVYSWMRVKKFEPVDSPRHWRYDREKHKFII